MPVIITDTSKQGIFNTVVNHLLTMRTQASNGFGACKYRDENGNACAVGCLIDDETAKRWDNLPDSSLDAILPLMKAEAPELVEHFELLRDLQKIHDNTSNWRTVSIGLTEEAVKELKYISYRYNLNFPVMENQE